MIPPELPARVDRRVAIQWMLGAAATLTVRDASAQSAEAPGATASAPVQARGYGPDPAMVKLYKPGDVWPLTLSESERRTTTALCDVILPADETSPSASAVGVPDFIDEWVSSPYPGQSADRRLVHEGLAWIEAESKRRFKSSFANLGSDQQTAICDDLSAAKPKAEFKKAAAFFKRFRDLTAGGYYTTPEGMKDIGYRGNVTLGSFEGPPIEALKHVGLA